MENNFTDLHRSVETWKKAQVLFCSPAWNERPLPRHIAEILSKKLELEGMLIELLQDPSSLVVAYTLITLEMMNSSALDAIPAKLLERKEMVTILKGSFSEKMELGAFARHLQNSWRERKK